MNIRDIIIHKRNGEKLTKAEIDYFVQGYTDGSITDYHAAALLMAIYLCGMTGEEIVDLTFAMAKSGRTLDLSSIGGTIVDKHSTGGIGDKVTLIVLPMVASLGIPVFKMSGKGLGNFGGTIDKLHSIPGFCTNFSLDSFISLVKKTGLCLMEQTNDLCLADKKIYAMRDAIGAVESIPLIASSVMSKKIVSGADKIVLEVTTGRGAFMEELEDAKKLADIMVNIGKMCNRETVAILTNMAQPLGKACGNALEIKEAILILQGQGEADVIDVCVTVGAYMLALSGYNADIEKNKVVLKQQLSNGKAWETFEYFIKNQGGDITYIQNPDKLPKARFQLPVKAEEAGYVHAIDGNAIGHSVVLLGGGRIKKDDQIDYGVGIVVEKKIGDSVQAGDILFTIHANDNDQANAAMQTAADAYMIEEKKIGKPKNILDIIK